MNGKVIFWLVLIACAVGAYFHWTGDPPALEQLTAAPGEAPATSIAGLEQIAAGSDLTEYCEAGRNTVFVFHTRQCPACAKLNNHLRRFVKVRPDTAFRLVNLDRYWRQGADYRKLYGISLRSVPHVMIYNRHGKLIAGDDGKDKAGLKLLYEWMNAESRRSAGAAG